MPNDFELIVKDCTSRLFIGGRELHGISSYTIRCENASGLVTMECTMRLSPLPKLLADRGGLISEGFYRHSVHAPSDRVRSVLLLQIARR